MTSKDENIIQVIQDMIRDGQSEEAIIKNLHELGVPPEKARKLLLVGQADIYSILQNEIARMVDKKMQEKNPELIHHLQSELQLAEESAARDVKEKTLKEIKDYEKYLENKLLIIESKVNENVKKALTTSDTVREKLLSDEARLRRIENGDRGGGSSEMQLITHRTGNMIMAGVGILFALATAFIFYSYLSTAISTEAMIIGVVLGLVSVTFLFVSTLL
ncbi:hypothetical protein KKE06_05780 [Candidatus Micrarchaeota archaeon]|nr:hypothetical protein [Candidatus Micrarchaeota archaeon]